MTLGIAVFILGCFYFYFKEPGFRKAVHVCGAVLGVLTLLGGLVVGAWYFKNQHDEKVKAAQEQARAVQVQACVDHSTPAGNETARKEIQESCERDPSKPLVLDMSKAVPAVAAPPIPAGFGDTPPKSTPKKHYAYATVGVTLTSDSIGQGLSVGVLERGERVEVVTYQYGSVKVRTTTSVVGWVYPAGDLTTVPPPN